MTCAREDDCFKKAHRQMQLIRLNLELHAKKCLRVLYVRGAVCCLQWTDYSSSITRKEGSWPDK